MERVYNSDDAKEMDKYMEGFMYSEGDQGLTFYKHSGYLTS